MTWLRSFAILGLCLSLTSCPAPRPPAPPAAWPGQAEAEIGILRVAGPNVYLNGRRADGGETVLSGDRVETGPRSSARIEFRSGGWVQLDENTDPEVLKRLIIPAGVIDKIIGTGHCVISLLLQIGNVLVTTADGGRTASQSCEFEILTEKLRALARSRFHVAANPDRDSFTLLEGSAVLLEPVRDEVRPGEQIVVIPGAVVSRQILTSQQIRELTAWSHRYAFAVRIRVPDVRGLDLRQAEGALRNMNLTVGSIDEREVESQRPGTVLAQRPGAASEVNRGAAVDLIVAVEPERSWVPDLRGVTLDQARRELRGAGLQLGRIEEVIARPGERAGTVVYQSPTAQTRVFPGTEVDLEIAIRRPELDLIRVPNLTGRTQRRAIDMMRDAGLQVGRVRLEATGRGEPGTVVDQDPRAGARVRPGTEVDLTIEHETYVE